ncbi:ATP-binding domain-containing protein [Bacillus safensis]|uniref:DEAD/DEAH box helicase n=1 Tax=Bacillus safensis TaxID=561879 RepID=UPI00203C262C|nr:ATP-binding domain-containing protein [Bacillus safensis]MCM3137350.1 ATP-binding domain-containing protein [Bacillus safensis]
MEVNITAEEFYSDEAAKLLLNHLESNAAKYKLDNAKLYYNYPLFREIDDDLRYPSFMLISQLYGIILIQTDSRTQRSLEGSEVIKLDEEISHIHSLTFSKLIKEKVLKKSRTSLNFNLNTLIYIPNYGELFDESIQDEIDSIVVTNTSQFEKMFIDLEDEGFSDEKIEIVLSVLEGSKGIIKPKERDIEEDSLNSKAKILEELEKEIAKFDKRQKYAALSHLHGPQRIRGLAGSGKTIILAMKAALLHLKYPEKRILYTFFTKSLYDYVKLLITRFYRQYSTEDPDFMDKIHILHSWGGVNIRGVYYEACRDNQVHPLSYGDASRMQGDAFDNVCKNLLEIKQGKLKVKYDYVLMDEAQDFPDSFYQICREIVKDDCIVWAYDDLQNIFDVKRQDAEQIFKNKYGAEGIDLASLQAAHPEMKNDIVLPKSYRNPREILVIAHALGFGFYGPALVQTLENNEHWNDVGYEVVKGECIDGEEMHVLRPEENSPLSISTKQNIEEIIKYYKASSMDDEIEWVCREIVQNIQVDKLRPDDIVVISLDDRYAKSYFSTISEILAEQDIYTNNLSSNSYQKGFQDDNRITLSSVYRAKGNEAPVVYVIGCDTFGKNRLLRTTRNKIFTAFTRAKAWLRVTGTGDNMDMLISEIEEAKSNFPYFKFVHKSEKAIKRDLAEINATESKQIDKISDLFSKEADKLGMDVDDLIEIMRKRRGKDE